ncbi:MAG: M20 family metallopeptidase [Alphaproteobacteria bacterium]
MSRSAVIAEVERHFDTGAFHADLARRVAIPTESQNPDRRPVLHSYLTDEIGPALTAMGYGWEVVDNPVGGPPFLIAERREGDDVPTVLTYGHGDVVRGQEEQWKKGDGPWKLALDGERLYGRGTADNKGQHTINLAAIAAVLKTRGRLGFNSRFLVDMGEEVGSPGLNEVCERHRDRLAADVLIASDGPRLQPGQPTLYMGTRGAFNFDLSLTLREGGHHSGNWGGLLANPGIILAHALASLTGPTGAIAVPEWRPPAMSNSVRAALADLKVDGGPDGPSIDQGWGEPGLSPAERVFGWNSFEVLAMRTGNPDKPVNAIPPRATAHCQIRYVAGSDPEQFLPGLRRWFDARGWGAIEMSRSRDAVAPATRLDPDHPWVEWAAASVAETTGARPALLPNLGGTLPNHAFALTLATPTIWVPHSYASCSQHAPDEHMLAPIAREGLRIMAGLFWDVGEPGTPARAAA